MSWELLSNRKETVREGGSIDKNNYLFLDFLGVFY